MTRDQLLERATERHRAGKLAEARELYRELLARSPQDVVALFRGGLLELQDGHPQAALALIEQAVAGAPGEARYHFGLGEVLQALDRWQEAAAAYRSVLRVDPQSADAHFALGNCLHRSERFAEAAASYRQTLALAPDHAAALANLGTALQETGGIDEAIELLRSAVALDPSNKTYAVNLGIALCRRRDFGAAEAVLRQALLQHPDHPEAPFNLGNALQGLKRSHDAVEQYRRALQLRPNYADALNNLGNAHQQLGEFGAAAAAYADAIRVRPDFPTALNNLGCALRILGRIDEAEAALRRGLERHPRNAVLLDSLGNVLKDAGELGAAIDCFRASLALDPYAAATHSNLAYSLYFESQSGAPVLEECRRWDERFAAQFHPPSHANDRSTNRRLRVGYVSPDFREHCQSLFTVPLLAHHDHAAFEIFCYASVARPDGYTRRIAGYADVWRDVAALDDAAVSELIRADRIDILVDLTMHMANGRPLVFARKPAPVQVAWLAYPGTTGLRAMDYRLTDWRLDPPGFEGQYSERSIRLPDAFWCYDPLTRQPCVNELPALKHGYLTFGCLNNPCKMTDPTLRLWGRVMRALPNARLLLMAPRGGHGQHLLERLGAQGVDQERIRLTSFRPRADYLLSYHEIDVGLDTIPYNGHTTSLDALWMGVPVITRIGASCVGRGGLSQLFQLGLTELAADSDEDFVAAAAALAADLPRLAALRGELRTRLERSALMNGDRFARHVEAAFRGIWREYCEPIAT